MILFENKSKQPNRSALRLTILCLVAGFGAYFGMYALRKPFNALTYEGLTILGFDLKALLIISQVFGYMSSKIIGVKIISEMKSSNRISYMLKFTAFSILMLFGFALAPIPLKPLFLFASALPLGMFWGIVFSYFEGRVYTELLAIGLSISAIISSGILKTIAQLYVELLQVNQFWIPLITALSFIPLMLVSIFLLSKIPAPTDLDQLERSERKPLDKVSRIELFKKYAPGLIILISVYAFLTVVRDFRDNYAVEIMSDYGYSGDAKLFSTSETIIGLFVLIYIIFLVRIKSHIKSINTILMVAGIGLLFLPMSTILLESKMINPITWTILQGIGIYIGYVPFQIALFERFFAAFREVGNVGFLMYLSDSTGYLSSVLLLILQQWLFGDLEWSGIYMGLSYSGGVVGFLFVVFGLFFLNRKFSFMKSQLTKPVVMIAFFFCLSHSIDAQHDVSVVIDKRLEAELLQRFNSADSLRSTDFKGATDAFRKTFATYYNSRKENACFSEAFYEIVLPMSRRLRLMWESKEFLNDRNITYPGVYDGCNCGKCALKE